MQITHAIELFLDHRRAANCARGTILLYGRQLQTWLQWLRDHERSQTIADLDIDDLRHFFAYLRHDYVAYAGELSSRKPSPRPLSVNTRASYHRTLRAFWTFLATEELSSVAQQRFFLRITAPAVPRDPRPVADEDAMQRLVDACGDGHTEESARNRAIVFVLFETGMRIGELCALTDEVVDHRNRQARVLRAKGGKHRMAFWQSGAAAALGRYLLLRRGKPGGPLFRGCSIRNNGGELTTDLVRSTMKRLAADAGISLPKGAPLHSLRHGFAHAVLAHGGQLSELADLLGHSSLETTRIYAMDDDDRLAETYDRIFRRKRGGRSARADADEHG